MKNFAQRQRIHWPRNASIKRVLILRTALLILVPNILLWTGIIGTNGIIMNWDLNFPITNENFVKNYYPLWDDLSSQNTFDRIQRLPMMSPFIALAALGLDVSIVTKLYFISTYTLLTFSMYLFLQSVQKQIAAKKVAAILGTSREGRSWIFSLLGGFIFAYNPVSLQFGGPISILFSVGILPLMLYIILTRFQHRYFPLFMAGLILLSTGHPFILIMNVLIALVFLIVIHIRHISARLMLHKVLLTTVTFTLLFAWFWVPYFTDTPNYRAIEAEERTGKTIVDVISDNNPLKIFFLERDRFLYVSTIPDDYLLAAFHYASLVSIVGIAISTPFIFAKKIRTRIPIFCLAGFCLTALFTLGTKGPLADSYFNIVSEENIGWIFRSPLKFQLYQSFFVATLFGISLAILSNERRRMIHFIIVLLGVILVVGASFYGIYNANFVSFNPIIIPKEYYDIRNILATENGLNKVLYYPIYSGIEPTEWSKGHQIGRFDMKSSPVPTYFVSLGEHDDMLAVPYSKFVSEDIRVIPFRTSSFYDYLSAIGVKYIVFHNDRINDNQKRLDDQNLLYLLNSHKVQLRYNEAGWYLFELKAEPSPPVSISSINILANNQSIISRIAKSDLAVVAPSPSETRIARHFVETSLPFKMNKAISENSPSNYAFGLLNNYFNNWHAKNGTSGMYLSLTRDNQIDTLLITKNSGSRAWLLSTPINVTQDDTLFFSFHMKTEETQGVDVTMFGYFPNEGKWKSIDPIVSGLSGDNDWKEYWSIVDNSQDVTMLRYGINPGIFPPESEELPRIWIKSPQLVNLKSDADPNYNSILAYRKITPYQWLVRVNVSNPYILTLTETFDRAWIASVPDGRIVESTLVNGITNGFYIDKVGTYDILLQYRPQRTFELGVIISLVTVASYVGYYLFTRRRRRSINSVA
jgi:hypothetical protein